MRRGLKINAGVADTQAFGHRDATRLEVFNLTLQRVNGQHNAITNKTLHTLARCRTVRDAERFLHS